MNNTYVPIIVGLVLAFFLLTLANVVPFWMPMMSEMMALLLVVVLMIVWAGFVIKEKPQDEREGQLIMRSGRMAYLAGLGILMVALIFQGLAHAIDPWITITIAVMVLVKLATHLFLE